MQIVQPVRKDSILVLVQRARKLWPLWHHALYWRINACEVPAMVADRYDERASRPYPEAIVTLLMVVLISLSLIVLGLGADLTAYFTANAQLLPSTTLARLKLLLFTTVWTIVTSLLVLVTLRSISGITYKHLMRAFLTLVFWTVSAAVLEAHFGPLNDTSICPEIVDDRRCGELKALRAFTWLAFTAACLDFAVIGHFWLRQRPSFVRGRSEYCDSCETFTSVENSPVRRRTSGSRDRRARRLTVPDLASVPHPPLSEAENRYATAINRETQHEEAPPRRSFTNEVLRALRGNPTLRADDVTSQQEEQGNQQNGMGETAARQPEIASRRASDKTRAEPADAIALSGPVRATSV